MLVGHALSSTWYPHVPPHCVPGIEKTVPMPLGRWYGNGSKDGTGGSGQPAQDGGIGGPGLTLCTKSHHDGFESPRTVLARERALVRARCGRRPRCCRRSVGCRSLPPAVSARCSRSRVDRIIKRSGRGIDLLQRAVPVGGQFGGRVDPRGKILPCRLVRDVAPHSNSTTVGPCRSSAPASRARS